MQVYKIYLYVLKIKQTENIKFYIKLSMVFFKKIF